MVTIRAMAPKIPGAITNEGIARMIAADAHPATNDARKYFQMTPSTGVIPKRIGLPAYQNAGMMRIQKEADQAEATPIGPHRSPMKKSRTVTLNSTITHRNQRSALPMERWMRPLAV